MNSTKDAAAGDIRALERGMVDSVRELEAGFRERYPLGWLLTLVAPFGLTGFLLAFLFLLVPAFTGKLLGTAVVTFFFFGRFIILQGQHVGLFHIGRIPNAEQLFAMVTYMDVMVALLLVFHLGFVFRLPVVGPKVAALVLDGRLILDRHPWMKRLTFVGLVFFVTFPLAATGSIGGCIFGRLLGMRRLLTFVGVIIGSLVGNGVMYLGAKPISAFYEHYPLARWAGLGVIVLVIIFLERRHRRIKNRFLEEAGWNTVKASHEGPRTQ